MKVIEDIEVLIATRGLPVGNTPLQILKLSASSRETHMKACLYNHPV
jgi:hypothetical protein